MLFKDQKDSLAQQRNIEDGGSLTIIATALVETGSRMDEVILKNLKALETVRLYLIESYRTNEHFQLLM